MTGRAHGAADRKRSGRCWAFTKMAPSTSENEVKCEKSLDTALRAQTSYGHGVNC